MTDRAEDVHGTAVSSTGYASVPTPSRYDVLLFVIPLAFVTALLLSALGGITVEVSFLLASLVSVGGILDGMFRNPPTSKRGRVS